MSLLNKISRIDFKSLIRNLSTLEAKNQLNTCNTDAEEVKQDKAKKLKMSDPTLYCGPEFQSNLNMKDPLTLDRKYGQPLPKVIIIGAGMAGLSAASHLFRHGYDNVVMLEASDRCGGKILTNWMGDTVIEMGCNTLYGASVTNSVFTLASVSKVKWENMDKDKHIHYLTSDGRIISDHFVHDLVFKQLMQQAKKGACKAACSEQSVMDFLSVRMQQEIINFPEKMRYDSERLLYSMLNNMKCTLGSELHKVSLQQFRTNEEISDKNVKISQGFCALLAPLIANIPTEWMKYNKQVETIEWWNDDGPHVQVTCTDGECIPGNFVLITLPLGVLQKHLNTMFKPDIPTLKANAICGLGVGYVNTVYLEYMKPWWIPNEMKLRIAWSPQEQKMHNSWTRGICSVEQVSKSKRVIMFRIGGEDAATMENYNELEIAIEFTNFIRKFLGDKTIPYPNNIALYRWSNMTNYLGSSVYMPISSDLGLIKDFYSQAMNCNETDETCPLLFAGEATHDRYFGTINGARMSGLREAARLLNYVKDTRKDIKKTESNSVERHAVACQ